MIGPDSLPDLRVGAKDSHEKVRAQIVVEAYNVLELGAEDRRFPPASSALIDEVVALLGAMQNDPAPLVSRNAKPVLATIDRHRK
jgi:hypothetical protein